MNETNFIRINQTILDDIADIINEKNNTDKKYTGEQLVIELDKIINSK